MSQVYSFKEEEGEGRRGKTENLKKIELSNELGKKIGTFLLYVYGSKNVLYAKMEEWLEKLMELAEMVKLTAN